MRLVLLIIITACFQLFAAAQGHVSRDSSRMTARAFNQAGVNGYKSDPSYQYDRIREPPRSLWDRFWDWFWEKAASIYSSKVGRRITITVVMLLAASVLTYFIFKLKGMTRTGLFGKDNAAEDTIRMQEDIHAIDFESAIRDAQEEGNFRLAVRLLYLQSIKYLSDRGLINWQRNKTNIHYIQELTGSGHNGAFRDLTFQFEKNWYGDLPIEEAEYSSVRDQFLQFNRQIQ